MDVRTEIELADMAQRYHEYAGELARQGRTREAVEFYEQALAAKRAALGAEHPELAVTLHNLALLRQKEGLLDLADSLWAEADRVLESSSAEVKGLD